MSGVGRPAGLLLLLAVTFSGCVGGLAGGNYDYGDAPDPSFSVTAASDGARHENISNEWLGAAVDIESAPKMVDLDQFDDGIGSVAFTPCETVEVPVTVTVASRENSARPYSSAPAQKLYLNMVFDFDDNKSWGFDSTECDDQPVNEWQVQNYGIDVSSWPEGEKEQTFLVPIMVGETNGRFCYRATLTYGETIDSDEWTGTGLFKSGETEDYCPPSGDPAPFCGDGFVDPWAGEVCDPPGSVCALGPNPAGMIAAYLCNNACQCPIPPPPVYNCYDSDFLNPGQPFNPAVHVCQDNCPKDQGLVCDPNTCTCEPITPPEEELKCYNDDGFKNVNFDPASQACIDNCPAETVCDSSCNCVPDDREERSCADETGRTRARGDPDAFNPDSHICRDDCDEGYQCNLESCFCEKKPEVSCSGNTGVVDSTDINNYDSDSELCRDDCEQGYECNPSSCTCTRASPVSCAANTSSVDETDINNYESSQACQDDCADGFECNASSCTCTPATDDDADDDGIIDGQDNCPANPNSGQQDIDEDGKGNACDECPEDRYNDIDGDGVCGNEDNCPLTNNSGQEDSDGDGKGNACDSCPEDASNDADEDGICGGSDNCSETFNPGQEDSDGDGIGDYCDSTPLDCGVQAQAFGDVSVLGNGVSQTQCDALGQAQAESQSCNLLCKYWYIQQWNWTVNSEVVNSYSCCYGYHTHIACDDCPGTNPVCPDESVCDEYNPFPTG